MASGFGGGLEHAGCLCGALTGANQFHALFREKFGSTCCRVLNPHPFDTKEHLSTCLKITDSTAEQLSNFLAKQGLARLN